MKFLPEEREFTAVFELQRPVFYLVTSYIDNKPPMDILFYCRRISPFAFYENKTISQFILPSRTPYRFYPCPKHRNRIHVDLLGCEFAFHD